MVHTVLVSLYPKEMWHVFASSRAFDVTFEYLCDMFVIHYSNDQSNDRTEEALIF